MIMLFQRFALYRKTKTVTQRTNKSEIFHFVLHHVEI